MEPKQLREIKMKMEEEIAMLLINFCHETGFVVSHISIINIDASTSCGTEVITSVRTTIS